MRSLFWPVDRSVCIFQTDCTYRECSWESKETFGIIYSFVRQLKASLRPETQKIPAGGNLGVVELNLKFRISSHDAFKMSKFKVKIDIAGWKIRILWLSSIYGKGMCKIFSKCWKEEFFIAENWSLVVVRCEKTLVALRK